MIRWAAVLGVIVLAATVLAGTYGYEARGGGAFEDEVLVYALTPHQGVGAQVPAGVDTILLTLWALLPPSEDFDLEMLYPYGVRITLWSHDGELRASREYGTVSRVTSYADGQTARGARARLVGGDDRVSDPRTLEIDCGAIAKRGGRFRAEALPGPHARLVARLSYRFPRGEVERLLAERRLDIEDSRRLLGLTTALGFADLPRHARVHALSTWSRRLTAEGRNGVDYRTRRLLIGGERAKAKDVVPRLLDFTLEPHRMAVLNLLGPVRLRIHARPGLTLRLREDEAPERNVSVGPEGHVEVLLDQATLRSVTFAAAETTDVRFSVVRDQARAQVGDVERIVHSDGRVHIGPDVRKHRYFHLDPGTPLSYRVAPEQGAFRVQVRRFLDPIDPPETATGSVTVSWMDAGGHTYDSTRLIEFTRSEFESFGPLGHASDATVVYLQPPAGVHALHVTGDTNVVVSAAVGEPGVEEQVYAIPYQEVPVSDNRRWRNAPRQLSTWATVRPADIGRDEVQARQVDLLAQVRLEAIVSPEPGSVPQRGLSPRGTPIRRRLLTERPLARLAAGEPRLFELHAPARVLVEARGRRAGRIRLRFYAETQALGGVMRVYVDEVLRADHRLVVDSGGLDVEVEPGIHTLRVEGLGARGVVYSEARPLSATVYVGQHYVSELRRGSSLHFAVPSRPGATYSVLLLAVTEGVARPLRIAYSLDGGKVERLPGVFFRRRTEASGTLVAISGDHERGLLLEAPRQHPPSVSRGPDGISRLRIPLGDDLAGRHHVLRVRLMPEPGGPKRVWIRALLIGEDAAETAGATRMWTTEAE